VSVCSGNITECLSWLHLATCIKDTNQQTADSNADERIPAVWSILNWTDVYWINWLLCVFSQSWLQCRSCPRATPMCGTYNISCTVAVLYVAWHTHTVPCVHLHSFIFFSAISVIRNFKVKQKCIVYLFGKAVLLYLLRAHWALYENNWSVNIWEMLYRKCGCTFVSTQWTIKNVTFYFWL